MRVLHGVTGQAGQPQAIAAGLREIGIHAETCSIVEHAFGYGYDNFCDLPSTRGRTMSDIYETIAPIIPRFDVFHFHARGFAMDWPDLRFPSLMDLVFLKLHGKKVFFHFRGQEIRLAAEFAKLNPFHYVHETSGYLFKKMPDSSKIRLRDFATSVCDGIFVTDPELQCYVPGASIVPRALNAADWPFVGVKETRRPLVIHAPSRRGVKGTNAILHAVETLKNEGVEFDFRLVENMQNSDAVELYRQADIMIDQLRIGWHGVLAVEGMALGKPIIAYIRDDLWRTHGQDLPIVNANPINVKGKLQTLIESQEERQRLSRASRAYFERVHDARVVAALLESHYNAPATTPTNLEGLARLLDNQAVVAIGQRKSAKKARRKISTNRERLAKLWGVFRSDGRHAALTLVKRYIRNRISL